MEILDQYVVENPSPQSVLDIFEGEWSSKLPSHLRLKTEPGQAMLFEDPRIEWFSNQIGGFDGKTVLEFGPLEAGHTYMVHNGGARSIVAIEANTRSYLKCLCIKEVAKLNRAEFRLGDAVKYLESSNEQFDVCLVSGILYHMVDPYKFLDLVAQASNTLYVWTHYYSLDRIQALGESSKQFSAIHSYERGGKTYFASERTYGGALGWKGFCGGSQNRALWLDRDSLFRMLADCGFGKIVVGLEQVDHPNGPCISLLAQR